MFDVCCIGVYKYNCNLTEDISMYRYTRQIGFRTTELQYKLIEKAARLQGQTPGEFIRDASVKKAKRVAR